ncbi:MAG: 2-oxoglutarate dehydrogenase complex dihydrolipoyllysine-residue succinyltransferase [Pseudomonadota bacterium]
MGIEVRVPTLGESVTEATVATWFKKPGDEVAADEMLCELETDKVTVEVPAPEGGRLDEIVAAEGETVGVDALLATISAGAATDGEKPAEKTSEAKESTANGADQESGAADAASGAAAEKVAVPVPALGESVTEATVATWFKAIGDSVAADEMLCELETDKVSVEVPSPAAGTLAEILAEEGATVEPGGTIAYVRAGDAQAQSGDAPAKADEAKAAPAQEAKTEKAPATQGAAKADGAMSKADALAAAAKPPAAAPAASSAVAAFAASPAPAPIPRAPVPAEDAAREERVKMTRLRQTIARRLKDAQNTAAMLTTYNEVDMSAVMALRNEYKGDFEKKHGVRLGFMSFFTKACCHALFEVPEVNAEIDGTDIVYKSFVHMGIAVGTPGGLVVPVVRDAHQMGFAEIEKKINELGLRARDGKLSMAEMQGGTFTLSNGGVYGSLMSSPILNPPQSGILGMHKIQDRPMVVDGEIKVRPMMYLALSYDHRIVDGKGAVTFLVRVKEALEDPRRLLMDL